MKLHGARIWYLYLLFYQCLKIVRFLKNIFYHKKEHKFLFILTPPYCGSTLLNQILSTSNNLSCNNPLGNREGMLLPEVRHIMLYNRWDNDSFYPWEKIKNIWMKYWDHSKEILMDKSPPNIIRVKEIKKVFKDIYLLAMVRNPYAHVQSIMTRNKTSVENAIEFTLKCLRYQKENRESEKNILFLTYEDLCNNTEGSIEKIHEFLPNLGALKIDIKFTAHNFKNKGKMKIKNLNNEKINRLSTEQIKIINSYFSKEEELLSYFGYSIINSE